MNILDLTGRSCSGCGGCGAVCPTGAIGFGFDEYGFYQPSVDNSKCVDCGKCTEVCQKKSDFSDSREVQSGKLVSAKNKDKKIIMESSSGGVAWALTQKAAAEGRYLVGCVYDGRTDRAKHIITKDIAVAEGFKGSKYIQSDTEECFKEVVKIAKREKDAKFILFGTPCQIYSLMCELEKTDADVIAVDLFCHGVPTQTLWDRYLDEIGIRNASRAVFRSKVGGWHNLGMEVEGGGKKYVRTKRGRDMFLMGFLDICTQRDSCIDCPLRKFYTKADIRLGDFWGSRYKDDNEGVSAILTLTPKGEQFVHSTEGIDLLCEVPLEEYTYTSYKTLEDKIDAAARKTALESLHSGDSLKKMLKKVRKTYPMKKRLLQARLDISAKIKRTL